MFSDEETPSTVIDGHQRGVEECPTSIKSNFLYDQSNRGKHTDQTNKGNKFDKNTGVNGEVNQCRDGIEHHEAIPALDKDRDERGGLNLYPTSEIRMTHITRNSRSYPNSENEGNGVHRTTHDGGNTVIANESVKHPQTASQRWDDGDRPRRRYNIKSGRH